MKTGEAEIWLKNELRTIYPESEAGNIANMAMEHLSGLSRADRMLKRDEPLNVHQLQKPGKMLMQEILKVRLVVCW